MNIRKIILIPLFVVLAAIAAFFVVFESNRLNDEIKRGLVKTSDTFEKLVQFHITTDVEIMQTALFSISKDTKVIEALKKQDQKDLLAVSKTLFETLKEKYKISHFYYHKNDQTNLIRLHDIEHYGDLIKRASLLKAIETGKVAVGVEQGPTGASVLRVVSPVSYMGSIIGYVELGKEFQDIVESVETILGIKSLVIVDKKKIDKEKWENRNNKQKFKVAWDFLPNNVVMASSLSIIPEELGKINLLNNAQNENREYYIDEALNLKSSDYYYKVIIIPFFVDSKHKVADLVLLYDVKSLYENMQKSFVISAIAVFVVLVALLAFFYYFLGTIEKLILAQQASLVSSSRMASLGEMANGMAHEINNPLAVIQLVVEQTQKQLLANSFDKEVLNSKFQKIKTNSSRISKIVDDLKAFSSREDAIDEVGHFKIADVLERTLNLCKEKFKHKDIDLIYDEVPSNLSFLGNNLEISQVFFNILNNAFDAVENQNSDKKWIRIGVSSVEGAIEVRVTDSGPGIPKDLQDKIFQPFFTTKEIGKGTGLGLSLALGIMQKHHGSISLDKTSSHTCFVVRMPLDSEEVV